MRGTRLVQIPTTLLAQVDSSVGGKTAIDYRGVKNAVGAFYQPERVFCDPLFLQTLPAREIRCGLGEIVKTGVLSALIGEKIRRNADKLHDLGFLQTLAADCIRFKAGVVEQDETEKSGLRKCLNLGHTTGHALELLCGRRSHGEYVLIGMWLEPLSRKVKGSVRTNTPKRCGRSSASPKNAFPPFRTRKRGWNLPSSTRKMRGRAACRSFFPRRPGSMPKSYFPPIGMRNTLRSCREAHNEDSAAPHVLRRICHSRR